MKTYTVRMAGLAAAGVMMAGSAFAGQTQMERQMSKENAAGKAKVGAPVQVPNSDSWEYRAAMETGNLSSTTGALYGAAGSAGAVTSAKNGSIVYRVGSDTP